MSFSAITNNNQNLLNLERINLLYKNGWLTVGGSLIATLTLVMVTKDNLPIDTLILWALLSLLCIIPRLVSVVLFYIHRAENKIAPSNTKIWENYWLFTAILPASGFAILPFFQFQSDTLICLLFIGSVFAALNAGAILTATTTLVPILVFINILTLPFIARCLLDDNYYLNVLGYYFVCFYVVFTYLTFVIHNVINENIELNIENRDLSLRDPLTALWNRRKLYRYSRSITNDYPQPKHNIGVIIIDIDFFKEYNDNHGHQAGDEALISVSNCIRNGIRDEDLAVRYGGEEFLVILPNSSLHETLAVVRNIYRNTEQAAPTTISAGIAIWENELELEHLIKRADFALYKAKEGGRNQFKIAA